jgi:putative spermidine/putrescine transport system permease protein
MAADDVNIQQRGWRAHQTSDGIFRGLGILICAVVAVFMLLPALTVAVMSFAGGQNLAFPPHSWGMIEYQRLFTNGVWIPAIEQSLLVGIPVSILAVVIGVPAALALQRTGLAGRSIFRSLGLAPLVIPGVAYAVALYDFLSQIGMIGTYWGLVLSDTMLVLPFVIIIVEAALTRIPRDLELVAMSLGAKRRQAVGGITLRLLQPAIASAFLLAFVSNFDEAVFVNFLSGVGLTTLPKAVFNSLRTGLDPSITAVATFLMVLSTGAVLIAIYLRQPREARR